MTLMLLVVGLSGCEELEKLNKPDYITVTVTCWVSVFFGHDLEGGGTMSYPASNVLVKVEIIKAGGERVSDLLSSDINGDCESVTGTFKLYREQPITCIANVILTTVEQYPEYTFHSASHTISWNEIYPQYDFGDSVTKDVHLEISGKEKEEN
jgi:hypothetical protein